MPTPPDGAAVHSRRGLIRRLASLVVGASAVGAAASGVLDDDAEAYDTFCGHTYTTGSCPHPTGLPRIDAHGYPLRAKDGAPVDDLGRPVDHAGRPVDPDGQILRDEDGKPVAPAPRSKVCAQAVHERFGLKTQPDGAWYRCCGGRVRKLVDCCAYTHERINGDAALTGYCYSGRKVFCVQYYETDVRC